MEKITSKEFESQIMNGIAVDIFKAERAYSLFKTIGNNSGLIDSSRGFSELFKEMQGALKDQFLLATARLFDIPSKKYPTRCIEGFLKFLAQNSERLPKIIEQPNLVKTMYEVGMSGEKIRTIEVGASEAEVALAIVAHFNDVVKASETQRLLTKLKEIRDKRLAHNELIPEKDKSADSDVVTFNELFSLVTIAKNLVGVVGWAYMSTVFMHDGRYILTSDAERPQFALTRLINALKDIKSKYD